jgi:uncharacterized membrane-anchored protein
MVGIPREQKHDEDTSKTRETGAGPGGNCASFTGDVSEDKLLDQLDFRGLTQEEVLGQGGLVKQLTGRVLQKILEAEMTRKLRQLCWRRFRRIWGTIKTPKRETTAETAGMATPKRRY